MSYQVTVVIACDHDGCSSTTSLQQINRGGLSKTWAAYVAREQRGWYVGGGFPGDPKRAFCPVHKPVKR